MHDSGGLLRTGRDRTFVPISWMCQKQSVASHGSTEAEVISLDACVRTDVLPALSSKELLIGHIRYAAETACQRLFIPLHRADVPNIFSVSSS